MNLNTFFASSLRQNIESFKMALADLSDQDLLQRPVPGANRFRLYRHARRRGCELLLASAYPRSALACSACFVILEGQPTAWAGGRRGAGGYQDGRPWNQKMRRP